MKTNTRIPWAVVCVLLAVGIGTAPANDIYWDAPENGNFGVGENWTGDEVPGVDDTALFDNDWQVPEPAPAVPGYTVMLDQDRTIDGLGVLTDAVILDLDGNDLVLNSSFNVGSGAGNTGTLTVQGGGTMTQNADILLLGGNDGISGSLTVTDNVLLTVPQILTEGSAPSTLIVDHATVTSLAASDCQFGEFNDDVIEVRNGGTLNFFNTAGDPRRVLFGHSSPHRVQVTVGSTTGENSTIVANNLRLGERYAAGGAATMTVNTGGVVEAGNFEWRGSTSVLHLNGGTVNATSITSYYPGTGENIAVYKLTLFGHEAGDPAPFQVEEYVRTRSGTRLDFELELSSGFSAQLGQVFNILQYGSLEFGTESQQKFANYDEDSILSDPAWGGYEFRLNYGDGYPNHDLPGVMTLTVTQIPEPGTLALGLLAAAGLWIYRRGQPRR